MIEHDDNGPVSPLKTLFEAISERVDAAFRDEQPQHCDVCTAGEAHEQRGRGKVGKWEERVSYHRRKVPLMPQHTHQPNMQIPLPTSGTRLARPEQPSGTHRDQAPEAPRILDAVEDQTGERRIRYGTLRRSKWISVRELCLSEKDVFAHLASAGFPYLTPKAKNEFKTIIQSHSTYRPGIVASRPGWLQGCYIFGDGSVETPDHAAGDDMIIAFETDPKFSPRETLWDWKHVVGPLVSRQPTLMFVLAFAFVGPLMAFVSRHYLNAQLEIVGRGETGKSTAGLLAASVWAGNPGSETGGAESWDLTLNAIDGQKQRHSDNLLVLDELNLAGSDERQQKQMLQKAVFKLASSGQKRRYGDVGALEQTTLAVMSTTNASLLSLVNASGDIGGAIESRLISITIPEDAPFGVFASIPEGFDSSREAIEALRRSIDANYGAAGRMFVRKLVREAARDETKLRAEIERSFQKFDDFVREEGVRSPARIEKAFALTYAAASLAREWNILPKDWHPLKAIRETYKSVSAYPASSVPDRRVNALQRIHEYCEVHKASLIKVNELGRPLDETAFDNAAGFIRDTKEGRSLLVPSKRFKAAFPDHISLMNELRQIGLAQTEGGSQPKLTIKAPKAICQTGRVYCISLNMA